MYSQVGQQVARFAMRDDRTMFLFTFADEDPRVPSTIEDQRAVLRERFGRSGWECPDILNALASVNELYFDRVSQIVMSPAEDSWTRGRATLVGDAAGAVSLLGGQGAALAMIGAYILAGELSRARGDVVAACHRYQRRLGAFIGMKQQAARRFAGVFAPRSKTSLFLRNQIMRLLTLPPVAALTAARGFTDRISLPDY
jgi:2-polyprenyl-6-methoxyphenol hydroxylase-like FAD-dependent oxidoreductase